MRAYSEKVKPPRTVFVRWPFGHPLGEPFNLPQQRAVLAEAFGAIYSVTEPGTILNLPFRWRRENYEDYDIEALKKIQGTEIFKKMQ